MNPTHSKEPLHLEWCCLQVLSLPYFCLSRKKTNVCSSPLSLFLSPPPMCVFMCVQERENACTNAWMRREGSEREECVNHIRKEPQNNEARTCKGCILGQQVFKTRLHDFAGKRVVGTHNPKQVTERRNQTQDELDELPVISSLCVLSFHFHVA